MNKIENGVIKISGIEYIKEVKSGNYKEFSIDTDIVLSKDKNDIEQIISIKLNVYIENTNIRETARITSLEGQIITGKMLIVNGVINQDVEYINGFQTQSIHGIQCNIPFSTYVVLPLNFDENKDIIVKGYVEDVYIKKLDNRTFYENIVLLIDFVFY